MADVFDVAKYILNKQGPMSTWKLQKLCYYAQAWHYTWTEAALFPNRIEAWANGPVVCDLYTAHRGQFMVVDVSRGSEENLTEDEKDSINIVLEHYGALEPYDLRERTHNESPWILARGDTPEGARCNNEITLESMGSYYGSL